MEATFRAGDETLAQLVAARREEVVQLQRTQADRLNDLETRGQARLAALSRSLPRDLTSVLDSLDSAHDEAAEATRSRVETVKASLAETRPSPRTRRRCIPGSREAI